MAVSVRVIFMVSPPRVARSIAGACRGDKLARYRNLQAKMLAHWFEVADIVQQYVAVLTAIGADD